MKIGLASLCACAFALAGAVTSQAVASGSSAAGRLQTSPDVTTLPTPDPAPRPAPKPPPKAKAVPKPAPRPQAPVRRSTPAPEPTYSTPSSTPSPSVEDPTPSSRPAEAPTPARKRPIVKQRETAVPLNPVVVLHRLRDAKPDQDGVLGVNVALRTPIAAFEAGRPSTSESAVWLALLSVPLGVGFLLLLGAMTPAPVLHRTHLHALMTRRTDLAAYGIGIMVTILITYVVAGAGG